MNFCDKCLKLVPDNEVKMHFGQVKHVFFQTVNAYKNQRSGTIGYLARDEKVVCGNVREPTEYEYFMYETCKDQNADET